MLREPLAHFAVLAGVLFAVHALAVGDDRPVIRVDAATRAFLVKQKQDLLLRPLTPDEQAAEIAAHIDDEILWREARRRGLDDNGWFRKQLIHNMRLLVGGESGPPDEATLRAFFAANPDRFALPPRLDLEHAYFADPGMVPADALARLARGRDAAPVGDVDPLVGHRFLTADPRQLAGLLGAPAARAVIAIGDDGWHGPIPATRGAYFVRVVARRAPDVPSFDAARSWVESVWSMAQQQARLDEALAGMRAGYRVVLDPPPVR